MATYGVIAYPFLERIREEMSQLEDIFEKYRDTNVIAIEAVPRQFPFPSPLYDKEKRSQAIFEELRKHYHVLEEHESAMVLASNDDQQIHRHQQRTKKLIDMIERVLQKNLVSPFAQITLPRYLLSCYDRKASNRVDDKAMYQRYVSLKDTEFKIALRDMQRAVSVQAPVEHVASTTVPIYSDPPHEEHLPSFDESQRAYR